MTRPIAEIEAELREVQVVSAAYAQRAANAVYDATEAAYAAKKRTEALRAELAQAKEAQR